VLDQLDAEDFILYYFVILDDLDKGNFDARSALHPAIASADDERAASEKCIIS
jgi:hypothetical protein